MNWEGPPALATARGYPARALRSADVARRLSPVKLLPQQVYGQFQGRGKIRLPLPEQPAQVLLIRGALLAGNYRHRDLPRYGHS
jgi:hypothetical protein